MDDELLDGSILYLSDARGVYIPRDFAVETYRHCIDGVSDDELAILAAGPDHEWYWDTWEDVERNAVVTDSGSGKQYRLLQDGDLWLVPITAEDSQ